MVELPPEIVKHLAPVDDGLSQASATIIAAVIAVVAALIAFGGVLWQVRSTATQQQEDRDAENRRQRRVESSQLLADGVAAATAIDDACYRAISSPRDEQNKAKFVDMYGEAILLCYRMKLVGMKNSAKALEAFIDSALATFGEEDKYTELNQMHGLVIETFSAELDEASNPTVKSARQLVKKPKTTSTPTHSPTTVAAVPNDSGGGPQPTVTPRHSTGSA